MRILMPMLLLLTMETVEARDTVQRGMQPDAPKPTTRPEKQKKATLKESDVLYKGDGGVWYCVRTTSGRTGGNCCEETYIYDEESGEWSHHRTNTDAGCCPARD